MNRHDVIVIGGGPAGLAAAIAAHREGASTLLIEREARLGGILKQCIHDGFGLVHFKEQLTGPEYAERFIEACHQQGLQMLTLTFVTKIEKHGDIFIVSIVNRNGVSKHAAKSIVLATGCRERTAKQIFIHGTRPSGVFTAGTAQHYINLLGYMPTKQCVILGSGDIGLIMARRLTLEGAKVLGVYEAKATPSGLTRNIHQCLYDFDIPLHLSKTVTRVYGGDRLTGVEICAVDSQMNPLPETAEYIECDALILSVGLIPENELAETLSVKLDPKTKGPICNEDFMTSVDGVFTCGNALHVNDLVDYVSESGDIAGAAAAHYTQAPHSEITFHTGQNVAYIVPQQLSQKVTAEKTVLYFRSAKPIERCQLFIKVNNDIVYKKSYAFLKPPEMERLLFDFSALNLQSDDHVTFEIEEESHDLHHLSK
ncbi:FAD-dependent oxidoreductase [Fusibacter paucivorans]|uniref:FAD-dependent oxidoreductase n=1 Tax=Fusibacter paucivorans TaxID=76009 RepID=A0ABS5PQ53_9FIRM|nr:FAD-dependent oxidoreductase [Fusibacter paucivorans]MBS7526157.1 FAD-dependent oxidoreductase [Fusibacter paucivorans]